MIALIALGYTLVYGIIELINFAHGDLFMLGSLTALTVVSAFGFTAFGAEASIPAWLAILIALVASAVFCGVLNVLIERLAYRRLRHAPAMARHWPWRVSRAGPETVGLSVTRLIWSALSGLGSMVMTRPE